MLSQSTRPSLTLATDPSPPATITRDQQAHRESKPLGARGDRSAGRGTAQPEVRQSPAPAGVTAGPRGPSRNSGVFLMSFLGRMWRSGITLKGEQSDSLLPVFTRRDRPGERFVGSFNLAPDALGRRVVGSTGWAW